MKQKSSGFSSYFMFMLLLLMVVAVVYTLSSVDDGYTREQFVADMDAGKVTEITVNPNSEVPTGYLRVELTSGVEKKLYVTDIV